MDRHERAVEVESVNIPSGRTEQKYFFIGELKAFHFVSGILINFFTLISILIYKYKLISKAGSPHFINNNIIVCDRFLTIKVVS